MRIHLPSVLTRFRRWWLPVLMLGLTQVPAFAQYCLPTYQNPCSSDDYINSVNFAGIVNAGTGCGSPSVNNYTNYTGTFTANIVVNQPSTITVSPGPTWGQYFVAMIDFNHDNDFADAGEFFNIGYSLGGGTVSNTITAPCGALLGTTRLRVMCRYANAPLTQADVCAIGLSFGEVEDYNVNITAPTTTDAALTRFISPVTACGMGASNTVSVRIKNVGGQTINSYTACYRINNGAPLCQTITATILPCDSLTHTFATPANLSVAGTYDFDAYVTVAADVNHTNDTVNNYLVTNTPVINSIPYVQNFDVTNGGWLASGTSSSWAWGAPTGTFISAAASSPNAWVTNLSGTYNLDELSYLTSPCFNFSSLSADPYLSFSQIFDVQQFSDIAYTEVSTDAGSTWARLGTNGTGNNWYNNTGNWWDGNTGNAGQWRPADHQVTGVAGQANVRIRFALDSDAFTSFEGMGIDDVKLSDTLKNTGAITLLSPLTGCQLGANEVVTVAIQNFGSHPISNVPICYAINGGAPVCETVPGPIAPGATVNYTFSTTANLSSLGAYNFKSYTNWSQDYTHLNDTVRGVAQNLLVVNSFPYRQSFEAGTSGWATGGTAHNDWAWGSPTKAVINTAGAGTKCWVTAGLGAGTYLDQTNNWVESPCFDMSTLTSPWVMLKAFWYAENSWDGAVLEATTNGGTTWTQIGAFNDPFNWYNDNTIAGLSNYGSTGEGWTGLGTGWLQAKHDVQSLAGQSTVRFRVHFATDFSVTFEGFAFDDFIVADPPQVRLGNDTVVCGSLVLNPNLSGGTFAWTGGATTSTLTVTNPGTYVLTFTDSLGLTGRDTIVISASPTPAVNLGANQTICHGDSACFTLNAANYPGILWSTGSTGSTVCVSTAMTLSVQATDALGCTTRDSVVTTVVALPTPNLGPDASICQGDTICIGSNCGPNHTYYWSNGSTTQQICVTIPGGYWMHCIDVNGCAGVDSVIIAQAPATVAVGLADTSNCPNVQFTNSSTGNPTGQVWDFGDGSSPSSVSNPVHDYTAAGNGSYTVTLISTNNCGSDTTTIVVDINCLVSIGGAFENQIKLFPNPSQGRFKLETTLTGSAPVKVTLLDLSGKAVYTHDFGQMAGRFSEEFNLAVSKGVYFVKMDVGGQVQVKKLVLQ